MNLIFLRTRYGTEFLTHRDWLTWWIGVRQSPKTLPPSRCKTRALYAYISGHEERGFKAVMKELMPTGSDSTSSLSHVESWLLSLQYRQALSCPPAVEYEICDDRGEEEEEVGK